ncbi:MAG: tRNA/tmRNA (uracil-C(5))-methyltransferase [Pseudidiomarina mangrovi]|nr:MAG: tRNA/tmRNA (uracil-C(5))-methyltransferase [Pseudidiomarina mangrovi]
MSAHTIDPRHYQQQLHDKAEQLQQLLQPFSSQAPEVFASQPRHYRMRAEFRIWHDGEQLDYVMFDSETKARIALTEFDPASLLINQLMPRLRDYLRGNNSLRWKLFQVEFLSTTTQQVLISLIYHRQLDDAWLQQAQLLRQQLSDLGQIDIIGRAKKQKLCVDRDWVVETLPINGRDYHFQQVENSFTQPNAGVNKHMIEWALKHTEKSTDDLLELYCGNGNFSLPLAQNFRRVLATEISKTSVASARYNCELNNIDNVTVVRMSAEDFSAVLSGEKDSVRAREAGVADFACRTVLVDPPRAGLDSDTLALVQRYPTIIYISCNPLTLVENLVQLQQTHDVVATALFDQFPYTHHMEAGVVLVRRPD